MSTRQIGSRSPSISTAAARWMGDQVRTRAGWCSLPTTRLATTCAGAGTAASSLVGGRHPVVFAGAGSHSGAYLAVPDHDRARQTSVVL